MFATTSLSLERCCCVGMGLFPVSLTSGAREHFTDFLSSFTLNISVFKLNSGFGRSLPLKKKQTNKREPYWKLSFHVLWCQVNKCANDCLLPSAQILIRGKSCGFLFVFFPICSVKQKWAYCPSPECYGQCCACGKNAANPNNFD